MFRCWLTGYTGKTRMFRHDIREKPVLYKEILKAISKRELLEDLVKDSLCWRVSPGKVHQPDRHH